MPASSRACTSCQRLRRSLPGTLVWANSSTTATAGLRRRMASVSISSKAVLLYGNCAARDELQALGHGDGLLAAVRLEVADDDVDALPLQFLRLVQHAVGLADAGGVAQVDLEFAARAALIGASGAETGARRNLRRRRSAGRSGCATSQQRRSWPVWPRKSCVTRCSRAKSRMALDEIVAVAGSAPRRPTRAPGPDGRRSRSRSSARRPGCST